MPRLSTATSPSVPLPSETRRRPLRSAPSNARSSGPAPQPPPSTSTTKTQPAKKTKKSQPKPATSKPAPPKPLAPSPSVDRPPPPGLWILPRPIVWVNEGRFPVAGSSTMVTIALDDDGDTIMGEASDFAGPTTPHAKPSSTKPKRTPKTPRRKNKPNAIPDGFIHVFSSSPSSATTSRRSSTDTSVTLPPASSSTNVTVAVPHVQPPLVAVKPRSDEDHRAKTPYILPETVMDFGDTFNCSFDSPGSNSSPHDVDMFNVFNVQPPNQSTSRVAIQSPPQTHENTQVSTSPPLPSIDFISDLLSLAPLAQPISESINPEALTLSQDVSSEHIMDSPVPDIGLYVGFATPVPSVGPFAPSGGVPAPVITSSVESTPAPATVHTSTTQDVESLDVLDAGGQSTSVIQTHSSSPTSPSPRTPRASQNLVVPPGLTIPSTPLRRYPSSSPYDDTPTTARSSVGPITPATPFFHTPAQWSGGRFPALFPEVHVQESEIVGQDFDAMVCPADLFDGVRFDGDMPYMLHEVSKDNMAEEVQCRAQCTVLSRPGQAFAPALLLRAPSPFTDAISIPLASSSDSPETPPATLENSASSIIPNSEGLLSWLGSLDGDDFGELAADALAVFEDSASSTSQPVKEDGQPFEEPLPERASEVDPLAVSCFGPILSSEIETADIHHSDLIATEPVNQWSPGSSATAAELSACVQSPATSDETFWSLMGIVYGVSPPTPALPSASIQPVPCPQVITHRRNPPFEEPVRIAGVKRKPDQGPSSFPKRAKTTSAPVSPRTPPAPVARNHPPALYYPPTDEHSLRPAPSKQSHGGSQASTFGPSLAQLMGEWTQQYPPASETLALFERQEMSVGSFNPPSPSAILPVARSTPLRNGKRKANFDEASSNKRARSSPIANAGPGFSQVPVEVDDVHPPVSKTSAPQRKRTKKSPVSAANVNPTPLRVPVPPCRSRAAEGLVSKSVRLPFGATDLTRKRSSPKGAAPASSQVILSSSAQPFPTGPPISSRSIPR